MPSHRSGTIVACIALLLTAAAPEPPATPTPPVNPAPPASAVQRVPTEQALAILGRMVAEADGKDIGRLVDVLVGQDGEPQAAVIDFGGFMGVGSRKIAVQWSTLHFAPGDSAHPITLDLTPDQIKAAPEYKDITKPAPVVTAPPAQTASPATDTSPSKQ